MPFQPTDRPIIALIAWTACSSWNGLAIKIRIFYAATEMRAYEIRPRKNHRGFACGNVLTMRVFALCLIAFLSIVGLGKLQAAEPRFRPVLVGNGPKALINLIDTKKLMEKGQGDSALSFQCYVTTWGQAEPYVTYRATPGSEKLEKEVRSALERCRFIPAIYNGKPSVVIFLGTVLFVVAEGKPHLRIYANQNRDDIAKGNDFIAPQLTAETTSKVPLQDELAKARIHHQKGVVELAITVDANGNQKNIKVLSEDPPGFNFGQAELELRSGAKYIPGFRNGRPVDCTFSCYDWFWMVGPRFK